MAEKHHFFVYKQGWIDDCSLNCLEKQYRHYQQEGSNSFIKQKINYALFLENSIKNRVKRSCDNI